MKKILKETLVVVSVFLILLRLPLEGQNDNPQAVSDGKSSYSLLSDGIETEIKTK